MTEFDDIDLKLQSSFAREDPPPGFAQRVFARTSRKPSPSMGLAAAWRRPSLVWSLAALIIVCSAGSAAWHQHEERVEGERAAQSVKLALRITAAKVQIAESKLKPEPRP